MTWFVNYVHPDVWIEDENDKEIFEIVSDCSFEEKKGLAELIVKAVGSFLGDSDAKKLMRKR